MLMLAWITSHWVDILLVIAVAGIVVLVICKMILDKRKGKSSCGCNCGSCAMAGKCSQSGKKAAK